MGNVLKGDAGGTAFPLVFDIAKGSNGIDGTPAQADERHICVGMSMRDYFAAKTLPEAIRHHLDVRAASISPAQFDYDRVANEAYAMADAMLKARG